MKLTIEMNCDNAAFTEMPGMEAGRILAKLARRLQEMGLDNYPLMDGNGNRVGDCKFDEEN